MILSCNTIACKVGARTKILDELIKIGLSKKDIYLLLGPAEILIKLHGFLNLEDFIGKRFDPIRKITNQEALVDKTQTLIVISEGKSYLEEPFAFLFFNTQPRNLEMVQEKLQSMPQVLSADTVFGPYDIICAVKAKDNNDLQQLISKIQTEVPQIQETTTSIVSSLY
jgi:DNA-binding Lrp family transcriptional regulator